MELNYHLAEYLKVMDKPIVEELQASNGLQTAVDCMRHEQTCVISGEADCGIGRDARPSLLLVSVLCACAGEHPAPPLACPAGRQQQTAQGVSKIGPLHFNTPEPHQLHSSLA